MTAPALMIQGTGSDVGKSLLVAGLARAFRNRGLNVAPFKPQNMSNNAAVTGDGGEIGRAQALQARAAGLAPSKHMNPVLLKPESETGAQVIVQGRVRARATARDYRRLKPDLMAAVLQSFERIGEGRDLVLVEGAGSPAEVNLRDGDIANMGFAEAAQLPVILIGDIDRGGVIASIVGTHALLAGPDRRRIVGYGINKFRGDPHLFDSALTLMEARTNWPCFGVIPFFPDAARLPPEDGMALEDKTRRDPKQAAVNIAIPRLSRIANFDDFDPLLAEPDLSVTVLNAHEPIPASTDLVILPGTKSTLSDLKFLRDCGWDVDIAAHIRRGGHVLGVCGGYQMLGDLISDPQGVDGPAATTAGLGLLAVTTTMTGRKTLARTDGTAFESDIPVTGYEIHMGETDGPDCGRPWMRLQGKPHGAMSANGRIRGCYLHGLFASDPFRRHFVRELTGGSPLSGAVAYEAEIDLVLDKLAAHLETHMDLDSMLKTARRYAMIRTSRTPETCSPPTA